MWNTLFKPLTRSNSSISGCLCTPLSVLEWNLSQVLFTPHLSQDNSRTWNCHVMAGKPNWKCRSKKARIRRVAIFEEECSFRHRTWVLATLPLFLHKVDGNSSQSYRLQSQKISLPRNSVSVLGGSMSQRTSKIPKALGNTTALSRA